MVSQDDPGEGGIGQVSQLFASRWVWLTDAVRLPFMAETQVRFPAVDLVRIMLLLILVAAISLVAVSLALLAKGGGLLAMILAALLFSGSLTLAAMLCLVLWARQWWLVAVSPEGIEARLPRPDPWFPRPPLRVHAIAADRIARVETRQETAFLLFSSFVPLRGARLVLHDGEAVALGHDDGKALPVLSAAHAIAQRYGVPLVQCRDALNANRLWPSRGGWPEWLA